MKRIFSIAFCVLILCSLLFVGIAKAGNSAYPVMEYQWAAGATIDGKWTTSDEWNDGLLFQMSNNSAYCYNIDFASYCIQWVVEAFTDNTNDTGDYWQICLDPDNSGGTAPGSGDLKIEIQGHKTLKIFQGTGTGWTEIGGSNEISWANTMNTSRYSSSNHWILEVSDPDKTTGTIVTPAPPNGMAVYYYDASTGKLGSWPPGSHANVPNEYGVIDNYSMDPIPEGFSASVIVLLCSVAVVAGSSYLRKRRSTNLISTKL